MIASFTFIKYLLFGFRDNWGSEWTLLGFQPEIERRKWRDLKYQQIEHKKGIFFDNLLANPLKMLWFISFEEYTYKEMEYAFCMI